MTLPLSDAAGITTSYTVSETSRTNNCNVVGSFCGDSESLLDRMLEQCQSRPTARHPGFGRKLVPYFSDDGDDDASADSPNEKSTNRSKERDGGYSRGATKGNGGGGYRRTSPRSHRRGGTAVGSRQPYSGSPDNRRNRSCVRERHFGTGNGNGSASVTLLSKKDNSGEVEYMFQSTSVCSLFAGPICFNSPPPEALPMPTAVLLAKAMCQS